MLQMLKFLNMLLHAQASSCFSSSNEASSIIAVAWEKIKKKLEISFVEERETKEINQEYTLHLSILIFFVFVLRMRFHGESLIMDHGYYSLGTFSTYHFVSVSMKIICAILVIAFHI